MLSAIILVVIWWIWFFIFDHVQHSRMLILIWLVSENIWQWLDIALYRTTPMLVQTPFDVLVYYLGGGAICLLSTCCIKIMDGDHFMHRIAEFYWIRPTI